MPPRPPEDRWDSFCWQTGGQPKLPCFTFTSLLSLVTARCKPLWSLRYTLTPVVLCASLSLDLGFHCFSLLFFSISPFNTTTVSSETFLLRLINSYIFSLFMEIFFHLLTPADTCFFSLQPFQLSLFSGICV